nr:30S ribosomal protein 2, chloroplastic [Ipomoea batatas]GMD75308.1 30S ribosomal protein 2, chloroplastic [Ipomoea batatas]
MATISTALISPNFLKNPKMAVKPQFSKLLSPTLKSEARPLALTLSPPVSQPREYLLRGRRLNAVAEEASVSTQDPSSPSARRLYVGNIPRTVTSDELQKIVEEHGAVEKAETAEDANAAIEKLNGTEVGGREIKVNITEKPLQGGDFSFLQGEDSQFIDSPHKVYVGNLAKTVTTESLKSFFAEKGTVVSAKVSRIPGTSKSSGFGFVTFSSEEDVEAAISSFNNSVSSKSADL